MKLLLFILLTTNVYAVEFWKTPNDGEITTRIPVNAGQWYDARQIYKINVGRVQEGDVFTVTAHTEFTNNYINPNGNIEQTWVSVVSSISASTNPDATLPDDITFEIMEASGDNISRRQHHHVDSKAVSFKVTSEMMAKWGCQDVYIIFYAWACSSGFKGMPPIVVGDDSGELTVVKY